MLGFRFRVRLRVRVRVGLQLVRKMVKARLGVRVRY